jgi:hypothetical protein
MPGTWGAAGNIVAENSMDDSDLIVEVLKSIGGPGSVWLELTDKKFSATFTVFADNTDEAAELIQNAVAKTVKGLAKFGVDVTDLSDPRPIYISRLE